MGFYVIVNLDTNRVYAGKRRFVKDRYSAQHFKTYTKAENSLKLLQSYGFTNLRIEGL